VGEHLFAVGLAFADFAGPHMTPRLIPPAWSLGVEIVLYALMAAGLSRNRWTTLLWFAGADLPLQPTPAWLARADCRRAVLRKHGGFEHAGVLANGLVAYPICLCHWPTSIPLWNWLGRPDGYGLLIARLAPIHGVAYVLHRYVERPVERLRHIIRARPIDPGRWFRQAGQAITVTADQPLAR